MNDRVLCEMPLDVSPKSDILEQWEMEESWLVVSANTMRALGFTPSNARPGEKAVGALVNFQATDVREATADERRPLMEARKVSKLQAKQRRAARKAERDAAKAQQAAEKPLARWARGELDARQVGLERHAAGESGCAWGTSAQSLLEQLRAGGWER